MTQSDLLLSEPKPEEQDIRYDVAALQVKLLSTMLVLDDLRKSIEDQALNIARIEERLEWQNQ